MLELVAILLLIISFSLLQLVIRKSKQIKKLTSSCEEHKTLLNSINLPIFYKDKNGKFIGCNKAFDISFGNQKNAALKELQYFTTSQTKPLAKLEISDYYGIILSTYSCCPQLQTPRPQ